MQTKVGTEKTSFLKKNLKVRSLLFTKRYAEIENFIKNISSYY